MRFFTLKCYFKRVKTSVILDSGDQKKNFFSFILIMNIYFYISFEREFNALEMMND